jgi:hypothetical protein
MDSVSHSLQIWTLVLVALTVVALVPTMFREIREIFASKRRTILRGIFDKSGTSLSIRFDTLLARTHFRESALRDALYDLRERGEIKRVMDDNWIKTLEDPIWTGRRRG